MVQLTRAEMAAPHGNTRETLRGTRKNSSAAITQPVPSKPIVETDALARNLDAFLACCFCSVDEHLCQDH